MAALTGQSHTWESALRSQNAQHAPPGGAGLGVSSLPGGAGARERHHGRLKTRPRLTISLLLLKKGLKVPKKKGPKKAQMKGLPK